MLSSNFNLLVGAKLIAKNIFSIVDVISFLINITIKLSKEKK